MILKPANSNRENGIKKFKWPLKKNNFTVETETGKDTF